MATKRSRMITVISLITLFLLLAGMVGASTNSPGDQPEIVMLTTETAPVIEPDTDFTPAPELSAAEQEALQMKLLELRERVSIAEGAKDSPAEFNPDAVPQVRPPEVELVTEGEWLADDYEGDLDRLSLAPEDFVIPLNRRNIPARTVGSNLAEPAAVSEGRFAFMMGNTHSEYSGNGGLTWTDVPISGGPASAPNVCCDPDVVIDEARSTTFYIFLYLNNTGTDGAMRLFVRPHLPSANTCSYTWETTGSVVPDYPHLGLSNNYLYFSWNNIGGGGWTNAQMYRYPIDLAANCQALTGGSVYTYSTSPQKVFVPFQGARETMWWALLDGDLTGTLSSIKTFWWNDSGSLFSQNTDISTSTFANPDCRGGNGNFDFIERYTSYSSQGFRMRGTVAREPETGDEEVWIWWQAADDNTFPNALIRSATINADDRTLVGERHIWSSSSCFGYPAATTNKRGHIGMTLAAGGLNGGGGTAAQGYVGIIDDYNWPSVGTVYLNASGTHNRSDGRFGDYFTARPFVPCNFAFTGANYALLAGTDTFNVNARFVQFMRERDLECYEAWVVRPRP